MIEKTTNYSLEQQEALVNLVTNDSLIINHVVVPPGKIFPAHMTESEVYIIITTGTLTVNLNSQPDHSYCKNNMVSIPKGVMSGISNQGDVLTELFVVKHI